MLDKIVIANRGEIALRILRACRELGIKTVAVHSTADYNQKHVLLADETVCIGPPQSALSYLNMVAGYLMQKWPVADESWPETLTAVFNKKLDLRYGENPHQRAAFYVDPGSRGASIARGNQLQGKELSFNNIADADTGLECVREFSQPACVIVKHANPCGVAVAGDIAVAYAKAYRTDPTSAFGGIIAFNRPLDGITVQSILNQQFVEVILAPSFDAAALEALKVKENVRAIALGDLNAPLELGPEYRSVSGGLLVQTRDSDSITASDLEVVTKREPTEAEVADLLFAWRVARFVKSNAIVYAREGMKSKNSALVFVSFILSSRNSTAASSSIGCRSLRRIQIFASSSGAVISSSLRVPERLMLNAGNTRFSEMRRSRCISELPVPLNSS